MSITETALPWVIASGFAVAVFLIAVYFIGEHKAYPDAELSVRWRLGLTRVSAPLRRPFLWLATKVVNRRLAREDSPFVIGYKWALIRTRKDGRVMFQAYGRYHGWNHGVRYNACYTTDSKAKCLNHEADHVGKSKSIARCTCGFHAVKAPWLLGRLPGCYRMWPRAKQAVVVLLKVRLSGEVVEHYYGYRAQYQEVEGIYLPPRCAKYVGSQGKLCGQPTVGLAYQGKHLGPACASHMEFSQLQVKNLLTTDLVVV